MDQLELDLHRLEAGERYLKAVDALGMNPEALLWGHDASSNGWVLILITSFFDEVGPLEIQKALFKAYKAAKTPTEIDPFIVELHSPNQLISKKIKEAYEAFPDVSFEAVDSITMKPVPFSVEAGMDIRIGGRLIKIAVSWIYRLKTDVPSPADRHRRWKFFSHNVSKIAA